MSTISAIDVAREERLREQHAQHEADRARFIVEHGADAQCPNCPVPVLNHPHNSCVLAALIDCVRDRGNHSEHTLLNLHHNCDPDYLWSELGPLIDRLEKGEFNYENGN